MSKDKDITLLRLPTEGASANDAANSLTDPAGAAAAPANGVGEFGRELRPGELAGPGNSDPRTPRVLKQRFVLDKKLGSGGMGTVYRARDLRKVEAQDRQPYVAVKVLNADFQRHPEAFIALEREASKSQSLSHPNIVSIFDFDKDGDTPFLTMELLPGQELTDLIRQFPDGLPDEIAWPVIRGLLSGLRHAHEAGVVHADFKPGNVFVAPSHQPKILDFGIARAVQVNHSVSKDDNTLFDPKRLAALTPAYASREMLNGDNAEIRDDIYSLGVVLYLVLTGHHPFGRLSAKDAAAENLKPDRPRRLSRRQWRELARCLRFNRADRPQELGQLQHALFEPPPWRSRTAGVALVAFCVALGVSYFREDQVIDTVKEEVRASTLLDAQIERLESLLDESVIDPTWHQRAQTELSELLALEGGPTLVQNYQRRLAAQLTGDIRQTSDLVAALAQHESGSDYLALPQAAKDLRDRLEAYILSVINQPQPTTSWLRELNAAFATARQYFPEHNRWAELNLEAVEALAARVQRSIGEEQFRFAEKGLLELEPRLFLRSTYFALQNRLTKSRQQKAQRESQRLTQSLRDNYDTAVNTLVSDACLSLEPAVVQRHLNDLNQEYPGFTKRGLARLDTVFAGCVRELSVVNPDRATNFKTLSLQTFGVLPQTQGVRLDPCVPSYLIGNGAQPGRSGYCSDGLAGSGTGGKLVVLPGIGGGAAFAIHKQEVSVAEYGRYCKATARCSGHGDAALPQAQVSFSQAHSYARWLSEKTGYDYQLPTLDQWQYAAGKQLDPNRNCVVETGAIARGGNAVATGVGAVNEFGLLNVAGNVREWVVRADGVPRVAGGAYTDPIAACTPRTVRDIGRSADAVTGFRLVRKL